MSEISIIIPVYNVEKYLSRCLDSVINQTFKDIEIICVNDGSTDCSLNILKQYAQKDNRITIIDRINGGLSAARNSGLCAVNSKYCYFVDSDDWIEHNTLEKLYNIIKTNNVDVVVHSVNNVPDDESCTKIASDFQRFVDGLAKPNGIYEIPIEINRKILSVAWNKLYKMDIINKYNCRFPEGIINEDELFIWTYMVHCNNYYYLNDKLYNYLRRSNSIMGTRDNSPKILDMFKIEKEVYKIVNKYKNIDDYKEYLTNDYIDHISFLLRIMPRKYRKSALKFIKEYYDNFNSDKRILKLYRKYKYIKLRKFINWIFSIQNIKENSYQGKLVTIFGIKIKFKNKYKTLLKELNNTKDKFTTLENKFNNLYHMSKIIENTEINKNKIVFNNFNGNGYGCNPKYIAEEIIHQNLPYELVWLVKNVNKHKCEFPKEIKLVEYNVDNAIREFSSAKIWISNQRMPQLYENGLFKKKEQYYIQTWHGSLGIKKCERSVENEKPWWCYWSKIDSKYIDSLISNSIYISDIFKKDFYYNGEILELGNARNDVLLCQNLKKDEIRKKVCNELSIPIDKKIILYAPTFRDSDYENKDFSIYEIENIEKVIESFKNKFGGDWVYTLRLHPNVSDLFFNTIKDTKNFINASLYTDMQELLVAADVLISDYSSCIYDFILTKKPAFIYAKDFDLYKNHTGFYYPLQTTPFSISKNSFQLIDNINNFNNIDYENKVNDFLNKKGCIDKGNASKSIVELLKEII